MVNPTGRLLSGGRLNGRLELITRILYRQQSLGGRMQTEKVSSSKNRLHFPFNQMKCIYNKWLKIISKRPPNRSSIAASHFGYIITFYQRCNNLLFENKLLSRRAILKNILVKVRLSKRRGRTEFAKIYIGPFRHTKFLGI